MRKTSVICAVGLCLGASLMADELGVVRDMIEDAHAKWTAGNTSVSSLSFDELRQLCGLPLPEVIGRKLPLP
ncbi:hypothetical protein AMJ40_03595, partial [candidate division TA06 bacterium DG_26]